MRALRHLLALPGAVARAFPNDALQRIEKTVRESETLHDGEVRFAVEAALDPAQLWRGVSARERAIEVFSQLRVWDTERNNGVLLYLLLAERDVEIVADRGFNGRVTEEEWAAVCRRMEQSFARGSPRQAIVEGIQAAGALIARHFPTADRDELPNRPVML
jgi:uncharacterized membrane protein